jgi:DNA-binding transcriptional ArsR family regulator
MAEQAIDATLRAVADGTRRAILRLVSENERTAGDIATNFEISRPAVSQHLRVLRDAGLVRVRPVGNRRLYRARPEALAAARAALDDLWIDRLERLARAAENEAVQHEAVQHEMAEDRAAQNETAHDEAADDEDRT